MSYWLLVTFPPENQHLQLTLTHHAFVAFHYCVVATTTVWQGLLFTDSDYIIIEFRA